MADMGGIEAVSAAFVEARRAGKIISVFPGEMPQSLEDAYRIQDQAISLAGGDVGGWKVGRVADGLVARFGAQRLAGPVFTHQIVVATPGEAVVMPVFEGFAAVEAELLLQVGEAPNGPIDLAGARDSVSKVCLGIEIASSPFSGINDHGPAVTVSDFGNNFGLVVGPEIADWKDINLFEAPVSLAIDGAIVGEGRLATMLDGPFGAFAFLNNMLLARGRSLQAGDWVSTGAITGVHQTTAGHRATAMFNGNYSVTCRTIAYTPGGRN
jgi:2-keto-4-pentenoate hydratase